MKPHVVVNNASVLVHVMLLAVVINSERLGGCALPSSIVMDAYLVYRAGFGRFPVLMGFAINISTDVLNIK